MIPLSVPYRRPSPCVYRVPSLTAFLTSSSLFWKNTDNNEIPAGEDRKDPQKGTKAHGPALHPPVAAHLQVSVALNNRTSCYSSALTLSCLPILPTLECASLHQWLSNFSVKLSSTEILTETPKPSSQEQAWFTGRRGCWVGKDKWHGQGGFFHFWWLLTISSLSPMLGKVLFWAQLFWPQLTNGTEAHTHQALR